jgi:hypothetical protein
MAGIEEASNLQLNQLANQCCGSGSARIRNFLQDPDPEPDPELEVMDPDPDP